MNYEQKTKLVSHTVREEFPSVYDHSTNLEDYLKGYARYQLRGISPGTHYDAGRVSYTEDINPDVLDGSWIHKQTSYIWKVGVLSIVDPNKADWAYLVIGHERLPGMREFIGIMRWKAGENDDIARCLRRYVECAGFNDTIFAE